MLVVARGSVYKGIKTIRQEMCSVQKYTVSQQALRSQNSTVDDSEVEKHRKMGHEWWSPNGPMKALHAMNQIRVPFIRDGILAKQQVTTPTPLENKKILDVACGGGFLSEPLARLGAQVTGVDASPELIEIAQRHAELDPKLVKNKPTYICTTIEDHASKYPNTYDAVVASEIIEHISNKELFVKSCMSALKSGGSIFFTTPNRTLVCWLGGIIIAENVLGIIPKGTHEWEKFTTPTELSHLLERNNCRIQAIYGSFYTFITNKWTLTNRKDFHFVLHAIKN